MNSFTRKLATKFIFELLSFTSALVGLLFFIKTITVLSIFSFDIYIGFSILFILFLVYTVANYKVEKEEFSESKRQQIAEIKRLKLVLEALHDNSNSYRIKKRLSFEIKTLNKDIKKIKSEI